MAMSVDVSSVTDSFLLEGEEEDADTFQTPAIYGREKETAVLLQTYNRVVQSHESQTVFVHGLSGHGKTALINKFRETVCTPGGLFCSAKYFQNSDFQEPHSAIVAAFSDLCDLVIQSKDFTEERRKQIRKDLGPEGSILEKVISNISPFLEGTVQHNAEDIQSEALTTLFRVACRKFLRAMTICSGPVVIFLDDIQWMDEGSKKLIELYLSDSELKNVMFILAYRDEEEKKVKSIFANVDTETFVDVPVTTLKHKDVAEMVARTMQQPEQKTLDDGEKTKELVDFIYQRTNGNPFHVMQFMDTIQLEGLLTFDDDAKAWIFDVQEVQRGVMVAASVADLLLRKIRLLPKDEQETLKVASLLGYDFDESLLFQIVREERLSVADGSVASSTRSLSLGKAYQLELVECIGDSCNFPHDKIQAAFRSMIGKEEEMHLQRIIGEIYLSLESDDSIYRAALHLNEAVQLLHQPEERIRLVRVNLKASAYASNRSAFDAAAGFLRQGLSILDIDMEHKWSEHFDLAFEITEKLARMELIVGNTERCRELTEETLSRATSLDMKMNSLLNSVECHLGGQYLVRTAVEALVPLGVKLPRKVRHYHVIRKFLAVRRMLRGKSDAYILQLPPMEDLAKKTALRILMNLCLRGAQQAKGPVSNYAGLVGFELTLQYGLSHHTPTCIILFAAGLFQVRDYSQAKAFSYLGKRLVEEMQNKSIECSAYFMWVSILAHWTEPLGKLRNVLVRAAESGFESGDVIFTPGATANMFAIFFYLGDNLQHLKDFMQQYYNKLCDLSQDAMTRFLVKPSFQTILNLQSEVTEWSELVTLTGDIMNEEAYFHTIAHIKNPYAATIVYSLKAFLAYNFGLIDLAVTAYEKMVDVPEHYFKSFSGPIWYFHGSLIYYEHYRRTGKGRHYRKARKWQRCLEHIQSKRGSPNARFVSLLQAEEKSFQKKLGGSVLLSAYDAAISDMAEEKLVHREALANERAGFVALEHRMHGEARQYFDRALGLYRVNWGAYAKHDWLEETLATVFSSSPYLNENAGPVTSPQDVGDILVLTSPTN